MTMRNISRFVFALLLGGSSLAYAQDEESDSQPASAPADVEAIAKPKEEEKIVVNQRKPFLHVSRVELMPQIGTTINDPFLLSYTLGGAVNYWFSDVLSVGVQGQKYIRTSTGLDADVIRLGAIPNLNQLDFYGGVHFTYVPVYGKFALFNQGVVGFDTFVSLGAGVTGNQILAPFNFNEVVKQEADDLDPRRESLAAVCAKAPASVDPDFCANPASFKDSQLALSPSAGIGLRFFISDFMTLTFDVKDYFFQETVLSGQTLFTQNVVFSIGTSFFFPSSFIYTTPR
jgi:outer membrane beta-barrel protein